MADIVKCFAFNKQGLRCMIPAGHDGDHSHAITWTDEECWAPGDTIEVTLKEYGSPRMMGVADGHIQPTYTAEQEAEIRALGPVPVYGEDRPGRCLLCSHAMHNGECSRCDCRSGIEG
jgi:hypothetical protein